MRNKKEHSDKSLKIGKNMFRRSNSNKKISLDFGSSNLGIKVVPTDDSKPEPTPAYVRQQSMQSLMGKTKTLGGLNSLASS
jgi:hypothetical protein